jgi:hypothetical protein
MIWIAIALIAGQYVLLVMILMGVRSFGAYTGSEHERAVTAQARAEARRFESLYVMEKVDNQQLCDRLDICHREHKQQPPQSESVVA